MAVVLDETFDDDPGAFGLWVNSSGATATWNAAQQSLDLVAGAATGRYEITAAPALATCEVEVDIEHVSGSVRPGLWLSASDAASAGTIVEFSSAWKARVFATGWGEDPQTPTAAGQFASAGRAVLTVKIAKTDVHGWFWGRLYVDGVATGLYVWLGAHAAFKLALWAYNGTMRVHSVIVRDTTDFVAPPVESWGFSGDAGRRLGDVLGVDVGQRLHEAGLTSRDTRMGSFPQRPVLGGPWGISGTTKLNQPPLVNVGARVLLMFNDTGEVVQETRSDAATGAYSFTLLDPTRRYMVVAQYDGSLYRAVIADNLQAEA